MKAKDIKTIIQKICDSEIKAVGSYVTDLPPSQIKSLTKSKIKAFEKEIKGLKLLNFKNNGDSVVIDFKYQDDTFVLTLV